MFRLNSLQHMYPKIHLLLYKGREYVRCIQKHRYIKIFICTLRSWSWGIFGTFASQTTFSWYYCRWFIVCNCSTCTANKHRLCAGDLCIMLKSVLYMQHQWQCVEGATHKWNWKGKYLEKCAWSGSSSRLSYGESPCLATFISSACRFVSSTSHPSSHLCWVCVCVPTWPVSSLPISLAIYLCLSPLLPPLCPAGCLLPANRIKN